MYISVIDIITEYYLCYAHMYRISVIWPYVKTIFKIALTVYTFMLLLEHEDLLNHIHICFILCTKNIYL